MPSLLELRESDAYFTVITIIIISSVVVLVVPWTLKVLFAFYCFIVVLYLQTFGPRRYYNATTSVDSRAGPKKYFLCQGCLKKGTRYL